MSGSPLSPTVSPNVEFLEHYVDCVENLPLDVQRYISQLREYDMLHRSKLDQIGHLLTLYRNGGNGKRGILVKLQKCLIKSQHYGDEKLNIITQMAELVESRASQLARDATGVDMDYKEEVPSKNNNSSNSNNHKVKAEKSQKNNTSEKSTKSIYDKPKRTIRRVRTQDKIEEKPDKNKPAKDVEENEEEEMVLDEEPDIKPTEVIKPKKEISKKSTSKEKVKDKSKDDKDEKKDEIKKTDVKNNKGKVTKKTNSKQTSKVKKKKKKEKELSVEDIAVDPDEPTYCICSSISYGEMIGCDNDDCQIEWFHFGCVNLTHKPKGKWYCPQCTIERKTKK